MSVLFLAWRNLFRNKRRTLVSLLTVAFGAASLLIYQGFNNGIMNQYRENTIRVRYGHAQIFDKGYFGHIQERPWEKWLTNWPEIRNELVKIPEIKEVYPRLSFYSFLTKGNINLTGRGEGVLANKESEFFTAMNFVGGRDLQSAGEVILGIGLAKGLNATVGDQLTLLSQTTQGQLNGLDVKVVGIFHTGSKEFDDASFRIDIKEAQQLLDTDRVENLTLRTTGVTAWPAVKQKVNSLFPKIEIIPFDELDAVYYKNAVGFLETQFAFIRFILLFVVGLGIFNTIAVGILERSSEIGALRANGETKRRLFGLLATESLWIGLLGGISGIAIALVLNQTLLRSGIPMPPGPGITRQFRIFIEMEPQHFISALMLPAMTTLFASLGPSVSLLRKKITELLRSSL
jgi:putative ABC transport system permease protein